MELRRSMIETDPPEHTRLRRLVSPLFTPKAIEAYRARAGDIASDLLDDALRARAASTGRRTSASRCRSGSSSRSWASTRPTRTSSRRPRTSSSRSTTPSSRRRPRPTSRCARAGSSRGCCRSAARPRSTCSTTGARSARSGRTAPKEDLLTQLVQAEWDGDSLTDSEFVNFFQLLIFAGNETTRTSLQQGMLALIEHPEQLELLRRGPVADSERRRGDPPLGDADLLLPAHRHAPTARSAAQDRAPATRSSCTTSPATSTRRCSRIRTASTSPGDGLDEPHLRRRRAALLPRRVARAHAGRRDARGAHLAGTSASS